MAAKPRPDISWLTGTVDANKKLTNKDRYDNTVQNISETSETFRDVARGPSIIAALGARYGQNPTADIARFKKSFIDAGVRVPDSWRAAGGVTTKSKTVNKLYRPMGMK